MTPAQLCKFRTLISGFTPHGDLAKTIFQPGLDREGCDMVQGFLYAKAQPASVFEAWRADYGSSRHPAR